MQKNNSYLKKGLYLSIFLIFLCLLSINYTDSEVLSERTDANLDMISIPKVSGPEINITTPTNTTYIGPMSGYYPGTFGFDNDKNGDIPYGWVDTSESGANVQVIESAGIHNKIVECSSDTSSTSRVRLDHDFINQSLGTLELWMMKSSANQGGPATIYLYGATGGQSLITFIIDDGTERVAYSDPTGAWTSIMGYDYNDDQWFHMQIEWNCTSDTWNLWIDGVQYLTNEAFDSSLTDTAIDSMRFSSFAASNAALYYIDALSFSWDPNYNVGDNWNEGLLLSYDNSTTLDWMGYSLDNQANVTIMGNTTFALPINGSHTIQVFGNDSIGTNYESDVQYFSVNTTKIIPVISISTPLNTTYTDPMSGYYPATYGFENDLNGSNPYGWTVIEAGGTINVIDGIGSHNQVVEMNDTINGANTQLYQNFPEQSTGTIEFWFRKESASGEISLEIQDGSPSHKIQLVIGSLPGQLRYYDGSWSGAIGDFSVNTWHHVRIEFDCATDWHIWLDDVSLDGGAGYGYVGTPSAMDRNYFITWDGAVEIYYIDAIGYSWDPDYNIGENMDEGLLLSFDNSTTLDWMGYSLDGQANITILGNASIPMPSDGLHTIQVYGNNTIGIMGQSDLRYFTVEGIPDITIDTPANITYTDPMSGYYPASYGFENILDGNDDPDWTDESEAGCTAQIISNLGGHNKVYELYDGDGLNQVKLRQYYSSTKSNGTVEYWIRTTNITPERYLTLEDGDWTNSLRFYIRNNEFQYYDSGGYHSITSANTNQWYHIKITFDCGVAGDGTNDWHLWIDSVSQDGGTGYDFLNTPTAMDYIVFDSDKTGSSGYYTYIDGVSYSWDPNYNVGDNLNEGLLLSFNNDTQLDWMGYSLDGQTNITIQGNTTIPMPNPGQHYIQVFGNSTSETMYESDIRYFTVVRDNFYTINPGFQMIDLSTNDPGLLIDITTTASAFLEIITTTVNLVGHGIGKNIEAMYFYNFTLFDTNFNEDDSMLTSMTIRLFYDSDDVKKSENLKVLHAIYQGENVWVWEDVEIDIVEEGNYIEFTVTDLSVFCLAEVNIPPGHDDDPFLVFLIENMWWILILAAVGVTAPTFYVRSKKKKGALKPKEKPVKEVDFQTKAEAKKEALERRTWKPEEPKDLEIKAKAGPQKKLVEVKKDIVPKPKKKKKNVELKPVFTPEEIAKRAKEIEKTEAEVSLKEKLDLCTIHKGPIEGVSYTCRKCHAKYCMNCAQSIQEKNEGCWVCETPLTIEGVKKEVDIEDIPLQKQSFIDFESLDTEEQFERLMLNSSNILKIWLFSSQDNTEFYNEMLDYEFIPEEKYDFILPEILKSDYEKDILHEKAFKMENKQLYCLIYFSKYLVNAIFISKNRIDTSYHGLIKKTIENLEEEYIDIKDSYPSIKDLLNGNLYLYLSRQYLTMPAEVSEMLKTLFKNPEELKFIQSEILKMPEGTFTEFLELYGRLTEEERQLLEKKDEETDYKID